MKSVAITGGGLLGTSLCRSSEGGAVTLIDARPLDPLLERMLPPRTNVRHVDVRDERAVGAALRAASPEVVVHTAALVGARAERAGRLTWDVNVGGTAATYRAARAAGARRFVLASSLAIYGASVADGPDEDTPPAPESLYGQSKLAAEEAVAAEASGDLPVTVFRLAGLYGLPSRRRGGTLAQRLQRLLEAALLGRRASVPAALLAPREYLHVEDAARAVMALLAAVPGASAVYNVGSGEVGDGRRLARALAAAVPGCDVHVDDRSPTGIALRPLGCSRLARVIDLPPPMTLEEGLARLAHAIPTEVIHPCA